MIFEVFIRAGIVGPFGEPQAKWRAESKETAIEKQWKRDENFYTKYNIKKSDLRANEVIIND